MANYFIEFRIMGSMKRDIRTITYAVRRNCTLRGSKPVPHITIVSNSTPYNMKRDERRLIADFNTICSQYPAMEFQFDGFGSFPDAGVAKINIVPSHGIRQLRWDLICRLRGYCDLDRKFDAKKDFYSPHVTIAMKLDSNKLRKVMSYLGDMQPPRNDYYLARATLVKSGKILKEYDFFLRRSLTRIQALNPIILAKTRSRIRQQITRKTRTRLASRAMRIGFNPFRLLKMAIHEFLKLFRHR